MAKLLFVHMGDSAESLVATSLLKRFADDGYDIDCVSDENGCELFRYCPRCNVKLLSNYREGTFYEKAVNTSAGVLASSLMECISANIKCGYGRDGSDLKFFNDGAERHYKSMYLKRQTSANAFQLLFSLAEQSWQGEGYNIGYYPRNRCRKSFTGVAVKDLHVRELIFQNLKLDHSRLWKVPFKQNVLRLLDEINRCKRIVTDDISVLHASCALRKNVEYIATSPLPYAIEFFGKGSQHVYNKDGSQNAT
jgi:hypothetical protein